jgi:hypothetical protein
MAIPCQYLELDALIHYAQHRQLPWQLQEAGQQVIRSAAEADGHPALTQRGSRATGGGGLR